MYEEKKLIQSALAGDSRSFERLVEKYQATICAITFAATGRLETSEELAQETFLRAWKNLGQLKEFDKFRFWLCGITRNLIRDYLSDKSRQPIQSMDLTEVPTDKAAPSDHLISQEEEMILNQALMQIPEEYREPLVLFYRQQQSTKEVAESLDLNEATVRTRMHRGRQMLKDQVAAMVENTLAKSGPTKKFTKAVMVAIGTGLAATTAATAGAAAAGVSTTASGAATGLLTATVAKITAIAAAVILTAGVAIYSYNNSQEKTNVLQSAQQETLINANPQASVSMVPAIQEEIKPEPPAKPTPINPVTPEKQTETLPEKPQVRHPDWPRMGAPVQYYYFTLNEPRMVVSDSNTVAAKTEQLSMEENFGQKLWIKLPNQFRDENSDTILIDNGKERIEVDKVKKTVRRSTSLTAGNNPVYKDGRALNNIEVIQMANFFRRMQTPDADPNGIPELDITQVGNQDKGDTLVYKVVEKNANQPLFYDYKAYVDAATLLPEKCVIVHMDEDGSISDQQEYIFDFAPIPDSMFIYQSQSDEALLPPKLQPGFSGRVVDMMNNPVAGADVFVSYFPLYELKYLKGITDNKGCFEIKIPDKSPHVNVPVNLPIYYWAILPDNPHYFAWTALPREDGLDSDANNLIPGFGGNIISEREMMAGTRTKNGISTPCQIPSSMLKEPVIRDVLLVMQTSGKIYGVISDQNGYPIADAGIRVDFEAQTLNAGFAFLSFDKIKYSARSNQQGYYEVPGLPSLWKGCRFYVYPSASDFVSEYHSIEIAEPLVAKELNIKLHSQQVTVRGVLKDNCGVPLEKRTISISAPNISINGCSAQTDPNGCFIIPGCPDVPGLKLHAYLSRNNNSFTMELNNKLIEKEKYLSFRYYPDVEVEIAYVADQKDYYVEMTVTFPRL
ncbi:MAG: sigma-70 family RNA polymerase sigma factor [Planctomycetes bacterium]|nr:sigma-70 family RNA polymerase sigma factor [Planctomycetota bacterium]